MAEHSGACKCPKPKETPQRLQRISQHVKGHVWCIHMRVVPTRNVILLAVASSKKKAHLFSSRITEHPHFTWSACILHKNYVYCVEFNRAGTSILSADHSGCLLVSDVRTVSNPKLIKELSHPGMVLGARWCNNGDNIITACVDGNLRIYDKHFVCKSFTVPTNGAVYKMACSGDTIVVGDTRGWLFRFSLRDPSTLISKVKAHSPESNYFGVDILSDDVCVSTSHRDKQVCVWDMKAGTIEKIAAYSKHAGGAHVPLKGAHMFFTTSFDGYTRMYHRKRKSSHMLFKVKTEKIPYCVTSCHIPEHQLGLFVVGCNSGAVEVYRCTSIPYTTGTTIQKVRICGIDCVW